MYPIEKLRPIVKIKLYEVSKQYNSKEDLPDVIKIKISETEPAKVKKKKNNNKKTKING